MTFRLPTVGQPFDKAASGEWAPVALASLLESQEKFERAQSFFCNPYDNRSERWYLAEYCLDYLRRFKTEGHKRKNGITESILHELDPVLFCRGLFKGGVLPGQVTYQIVNGRRFEIEPAFQSIEMLFCAILIHDLEEDFPSASRRDLRNYLFDRVHQETLEVAKKEQLSTSIRLIGSTLKTQTFGRTKYDKTRHIVTEQTYDGDPQQYYDGLERNWAAIGAKATDRMGGLVTRFENGPGVFPIDRNIAYLQETYDLFGTRQILEKMQERYPELAAYFKVLNARIDIAYRCANALISYHPENPMRTSKKTSCPNTARIELSSTTIQAALPGAEHIPPDVCPFTAMLKGFSTQANLHSQLTPLVQQMRNQLGKSFSHLKAANENKRRQTLVSTPG